MNSDLYLINIDGSGLKRLTDDTTTNIDSYAHWSNSNNKIIYTSRNLKDQSKVMVMDIDGSNKITINEDGQFPA